METETQAAPNVGPTEIPENLESVIKATVEQTIAGILSKGICGRGRGRSRSYSRSRSGSRSGSRGRRDRSRSRGKRDRSGSRHKGGRKDWDDFGCFPRHHYHYHHGPPGPWVGNDQDLPARWGKWGRHGRRSRFPRGYWDNCDSNTENNVASNENKKEGTPVAEQQLTGDFQNIRVSNDENEMD